MPHKRYSFFLLLLLAQLVQGQNLIPNGDFEQYVGCPQSISQIDSASYWFNPTLPLSGGTPDYLNQCASAFSQVSVPDNYFGHQAAQHGNAYGGAYCRIATQNNYREYMETRLTSKLSQGVCYHFEMYINLADLSRYTSDAIGAYFSDTAVRNVSNDTILPFVPQITNTTGNFPDTAQWTLVAGDFTAHGSENYLIIGNFSSDTNTTLIFKNGVTHYPVVYFLVDNASLVACPSVGLEELSENNKLIPYPNPFKDRLNFTASDEVNTKITLFDFSCRKLLQHTFTNSTTINTEQLAAGIYFYEISNSKGTLKTGKVVKQ